MRHHRSAILIALLVFLIGSFAGKAVGQATYQDEKKPVSRIMRFRVIKFNKPNEWQLLPDSTWCPQYKSKADNAEVYFSTEYGGYTGVFSGNQSIMVCSNVAHLIGTPGGELPQMKKLSEEEAEKRRDSL